MQTKLLREIQGAYDNLRKSEKLVADFILEHSADVIARSEERRVGKECER